MKLVPFSSRIMDGDPREIMDGEPRGIMNRDLQEIMDGDPRGSTVAAADPDALTPRLPLPGPDALTPCPPRPCQGEGEPID